MPHSYSSCLIHYVFSTKDRRRVISPALQERLGPYLGGIARENEMKALAVGGVEDHVHMLVSLPSTLAVAKGVQLIKGGSSKWIHDTFPEQGKFAWQEGYGAFSIGVSGVEETIAYISRQAEHHRVKTFEEEFIAFLERHGIAYDPRYVFG
jgi:REP element-mobilizing transposase RayT